MVLVYSWCEEGSGSVAFLAQTKRRAQQDPYPTNNEYREWLS